MRTNQTPALHLPKVVSNEDAGRASDFAQIESAVARLERYVHYAVDSFFLVEN